MSNNIPFRPVVGTNKQILKQEPAEGYVWFATDVKKIYYSDGNAFLSMGGNTGIYYGQMELDYEPDSDETEFDFAITDIDGNENVTDGNYKKPNKDDLILNIPDGCFYRVIEVIELLGNITIKTEKLTIAGAGGTGGGPAASRLLISDVDGTTVKYFTKDTKSALLRFNVSSTTLEGNGIASIVYKVGTLDVINDNDYKDFGIIEFDLMPYISKMSTSTYTTVSIQVEDLFGARKSITYNINVVELALKSIYTDSILMTTEGTLFYNCVPSGGTTLTNRQVVVSFYDENNNHYGEDISQTVSTSNSAINIEIPVPAIGVYTMNIQYKGKLPNGIMVGSNILSYQVVYYDEEPQLVVSIPFYRVEQYSTLDITYMVAQKTSSVDKVSVTLNKNTVESIQEIDYNTQNVWSIYFDTPGSYDLIIEAVGVTKMFNDIIVYPYEGSIPVINTNGLDLNLSAVNRSNTEINKDSWESNGYTCNFENFSWGKVNGWQKDKDGIDVLHLSSGAKLTVSNFYPFDINSMENGQTIELDFCFTGVTDLSKPLITCLSKANNQIQVGFQVTGQESALNTGGIKATGGSIIDSEDEQIYNTQIQGLTAKFIEGRRIHLTWVIESKKEKYPMIRTYLNGIVCGITQYDKSDYMLQNNSDPARIIFDSTYGNIDIYNIRVYKRSPLAAKVVLDNYIATFGTAEQKTLKNKDNSCVLDSDNKISIQNIETEFNNGNFKLSVPYIKIIGGQSLTKDDEGYKLNTIDTTQHLPTAKKDYRLIEKYEFIDQNGVHENMILESTFKDDGYLNGIAMYGQGTSSMEYPVKNLRFKAKMRDANNEKVKFSVNDCKVDLVCLKADYMESSGSHNTGTGNLVYQLNKAMGLETPGQTYYKDKVDYDVVSAIRGFPVIIFYKNASDPEDTPFEFIGKYNFNLDKATHEPFGFYHDENSNFGWNPNGYIETNINNEDAFNNYPFDVYTKTENDEYIKVNSFASGIKYYSIENKIHCFEFLNNGNSLDNFLKADNDETFEETFYKITDEGKPNWYTAYESRYPEFDDADSTDVASWFEVCNWVASTKDNIEKFKSEFDEHFNFDFTCFYYLLTHVLLMIDSRAKNMMMATWDNQHWYPIFYDMDTMLGLNNYGYNKFNYDVEDTELGIYNGQNSVFWNNFREAFPNEINNFYQEMASNGLTYNNLLNNYNNNQADAVNESIYNSDSDYKYKRPFSEGFIDSSGDEVVEVAPGSRDYLYASQGPRSMHREWWLNGRINYFNGKHLTESYKKDRYIMRLYTPQKGNIYYKAIYDLTEDQFNEPGVTYYIYIEESDSYILATEYNEGTIYYVQESTSGKLDASINAVPPNNDFLLTPLYNQYLSVAYGGDNGTTTVPIKVNANTEQRIIAPSATYNDTETYVYGGSMIKDLGDLSAQYIGQFHFPDRETKLEKLVLGNFNNDYYNPNFSSLNIGSTAPYLKELNITNCIGLSQRTLNIENCQQIQKIYATGSGLINIVLPEYGVINELRLPETIQNLTIINQSSLSNENFTIGTCSYNIETKEKTYVNKTGNITNLRIENTLIDSYSLVMNNPALQRFYLIGVNWNIDNSDDIILDNENPSIAVLDFLLQKAPVDGLSIARPRALTGTITLDCDALGIDSEIALKICEKYTYPKEDDKYFPNIDFIFDGLDIYNVDILDGNDNIIWTRKIASGGQITEIFLSDGPMGEFTVPQMRDTAQYTYTFDNIWYINDNEIEYAGSNDPYGWPIINYTINSDIVLKPKFIAEIRKYWIHFINDYDSTFKYDMLVEYNKKVSEIIPTEIPYRSDNGLPLKETYGFVGYNTDKNANEGIEFTDSNVITSEKTYYAIFSQISVYDNIHLDYFNYTKSSYPDAELNDFYYEVSENKDKKLRGKITIPSKYDGLNVLSIDGFNGNNDITHIFFEKDSTLKTVDTSAFESCLGLEYFEFIDSIQYINNSAFKECPLKPNYNETDYIFSKSLKVVRRSAFNKAFNYEASPTFYLPASLMSIEPFGFSNFNSENYGNRKPNFIIGSPNEYSNLIVGSNISLNANERENFRSIKMNYGINQIDFYSLNYNDLNKEITDQSGAVTDTLRNWLGDGVNSNSMVNQFNLYYEGAIVQYD